VGAMPDDDPDQSRSDPSSQGREDEKERVDRELIELLNELRVVLPGVQVLFAFLLTVPFSNGYSRMTDLQRNMYFVTFIATALATILLIAPSTYHRLLFRRGDKERMLYTSNRLTITGTVFLAVAMATAVFVITDVLFGAPVAALTAAVAAVTLAGFWYVLPLWRRLRQTGRT
jgi:hypothetical protein